MLTVKKILFPVDFSEYSRSMNRQVEWLVKNLDAHVTLLHVFDFPQYWYGGFEPSLMMPQEDYVSAAGTVKQHLREYDIDLPEGKVDRVLLDGNPALEIAKWAADHDVDLIVIGTHGFGPIRRLLLGSVAMKVLHDVSCPVWTQPARSDSNLNPDLGISQIVCSLELNDEALPLLRYTKAMANLLGASVDLVHCIPETQSRPAKYFDYDFNRSLRDLATDEIGLLQAEAGTNFPVHLTDHQLADDIAAVAKRMDADLVIIGRGKVQSSLGTLRTRAYDIICQVQSPVISFAGEQEHPQSEVAISEAELQAVI